MPSRLLLSLAGAGLVAAAAAGQPLPDPTDAAAPTAPLDHHSSFEGYRRYEPQKPAPWRASNRAVGAPSPDRAVDTAPATPPPDRAVETAPAGGHAGHKH
ncbi:hypothetical protein [Desertibaculum subflavum]|uniref:hypothetical protein n=1 Tax=Desertibaculum subflavum TaxID=2268458 RepID=UPI000E6744C2